MVDPLNSFVPNPTIYENTGRETRGYDVFSRLLKDRIVFLGTAIDDTVANLIIAQLLFLQMEDSKKDIHMYIHSPGGYVTAGMAIYDTMQFMTCDVATYCIGMAASMGAVLLAAGTKGKRFAPECARHDPPAERRRAWPGQRHQHPGQGNPTPEEELNEIMAYHTGQPVERIDRTWSATIT
jgi:ATP-dependent Clp protease protease subunit